MNKLLENELFKHDLISIDRFAYQYGNLGILHPHLGVKLTFFDCNEETEITDKEYDENIHSHYYFVNYDEVLEFFDTGAFFNATHTVFSDLSYAFRKELTTYLANINDKTAQKQIAYEIKLHFISISANLLAIKNTNPIQKEIIELFISQYESEIKYLDKLCLLYSDPFTGDSNASNDEILQSVIDGILESKIGDLMAEIKLTKESQGSELLSIKEAMKFLNLKPTTFYRMRNSGAIPEYMIDKRTYFKKSELMNSLIRVN